MSYAISLALDGAISNYGELIAHLRDMADDAGYSRDAIDASVRKAEAFFNRELRVPDMEKVAALAVSSATTPLPSDFLALRAIFATNEPCHRLRSMSPAAMMASYRQQSGTPMAYAIEGRQLRVAPFATSDLTLLYYAAIPALTDSQPSNWLLDAHADLYVAGAMYHMARRERDADGQAQAAQEVGDIISSVNAAGSRARWGAAPLSPGGIGQVRGATI